MSDRTNTLTGAEELRRTAALLNNCREDFLDRYSAAQLITLARAYRASGWDIAPDLWTDRQVSDALKGFAPAWDEHGQPAYGRSVRFQILIGMGVR